MQHAAAGWRQRYLWFGKYKDEKTCWEDVLLEGPEYCEYCEWVLSRRAERY